MLAIPYGGRCHACRSSHVSEVSRYKDPKTNTIRITDKCAECGAETVYAPEVPVTAKTDTFCIRCLKDHGGDACPCEAKLADAVARGVVERPIHVVPDPPVAACSACGGAHRANEPCPLPKSLPRRSPDDPVTIIDLEDAVKYILSRRAQPQPRIVHLSQEKPALMEEGNKLVAALVMVHVVGATTKVRLDAEDALRTFIRDLIYGTKTDG